MTVQQADAQAIVDVTAELSEARDNHGRFASAHEGHSVIQEELRELEAWVFTKRQHRDHYRMRQEAIQLAAMALKFAADAERFVRQMPALPRADPTTDDVLEDIEP